MSELRNEVRAKYGEAALAVSRDREAAEDPYASCCGEPAQGASCCGGSQVSFGPTLYDELERDGLPDAAVLASLGCGNPMAVADLREGETVLDLGSGGGIDVLLSARRVGSTGKVYGLDMTDEMLELAEANRKQAGADNVEFLKGYIEEIPLEGESVDVIISNCVINLSSDKPAVFSEMQRVLRPGGRLGITDVVASDDLTVDDRAQRGSYTGCIAGALSFGEYRAALAAAGFVRIEVVPTHDVADGMHSAIVRAVKTAARVRPAGSPDRASVERLVRSAELPTEGLVDAWRTWVAEDGTKAIGTASIERHGNALLLRSLAVAPDYRNQGIGELLVRTALDAAGPGPVTLLTETAAEWFRRFGFRTIARSSLDPALHDSVEVRELCSDSAVALTREPRS